MLSLIGEEHDRSSVSRGDVRGTNGEPVRGPQRYVARRPAELDRLDRAARPMRRDDRDCDGGYEPRADDYRKRQPRDPPKHPPPFAPSGPPERPRSERHQHHAYDAEGKARDVVDPKSSPGHVGGRDPGTNERPCAENGHGRCKEPCASPPHDRERDPQRGGRRGRGHDVITPPYPGLG